MLSAQEGRMGTSVWKTCRAGVQLSALYKESFLGEGCAHVHVSEE